MLLRTNQYVLLCDVMGYKAQPLEPFLGPRRQLRSWKGPGLGLARPGRSSAPARLWSGDARPASPRTGWIPHPARFLPTANDRIPAGPACNVFTAHP